MKVDANNISFLKKTGGGDVDFEREAPEEFSEKDDAAFSDSPPTNIHVDIEEELQRLLSLRSFHVLEKEEYQECHNRFANIARSYFHVPLAKIILVDMERCWSLACAGDDTEIRDTERWGSIYDEAAKDPAQFFCITDMESEVRYQNMRSTSNLDEHRFFASTPLVSQDGHRIGVLAVMDYDPRPMPSADDVMFLKDTASSLMDLLELKRDALRGGIIQSSLGLLRSARFVRDCIRDVHDDDELQMMVGDQHKEVIQAARTNAEILCSAFAAASQPKQTTHEAAKAQLCSTSRSNKMGYC